MSESRVRVLLADDNGLVAAGIRELLETRHRVVGVAGSGRELLEAALELRPDVILTDIAMPGFDGLEATRRLAASLPGVPVIILTMLAGAGHVKAAFEAGAAGYLVKSSASRELFDALEEVLAGRRYLTPTLAGEVMSSLLFSKPAPTKPVLTDRETEVAVLVAQGLENSEIAERLSIARVTVRTHFLHILRKLGLKNRVELARHALAQGWASLEDVPRIS